MIAIVDVGIGNLSSVRSGFRRVGETETMVVSSGEEFAHLQQEGVEWTGIVLPGVGAFGDAMFQLRSSGLLLHIRNFVRTGKPLLGICLGMQLLLSMSEEYGAHVGLNMIPGRVVRFKDTVKVPHMGWNNLSMVATHPLLRGVSAGDFVYFVHSYYAVLNDPQHMLAGAEYGGVVVPGVIAKDSVYGIQFHPEKSGAVGEQILRNFAGLCRGGAVQEGGGQRVSDQPRV